ncbi:acyl-CoA reductase [Kiloniella sp.]|uniref:acyl-CoA reductase n=1 Tax=Kiloniella sp. TaxID=1938587 RepID=UPI003A91202D
MKFQQLIPQKKTISLEQLRSNLLLSNSYVPPSQQRVIEFLNTLSHELFNSVSHSQDPEISALAFWLRKGSILPLVHDRTEAIKAQKAKKRARGVVFLMPPTNVGLLFCYQMALALLTGNKVIIRISPSAPVNSFILCDIIRALLRSAKHQEIANNFHVFSYDHQKEITEAISQNCDLRLIWGGNKTVQKIRTVPLAPKAMDVSFSDRFSWAVIKTNQFLELGETKQIELVKKLRNDITLFDQQACTSPKILCWIGTEDEREHSSKILRKILGLLSGRTSYEIDLAGMVEKHENLYSLMALLTGSKQHSIPSDISFLTTKRITKEDLLNIHDFNKGNGILIETGFKAISELTTVISSKEQTLSYYGYTTEELNVLSEEINGPFFDTLIPIGKAHTFSHIWDGYNLFDLYQRDVRVTK